MFHQSLPPSFRMLIPPQGGTFAGPAKTLCAAPEDPPSTSGRTVEGSVAALKRFEAYITTGDVVVLGPFSPDAEMLPFEWIGGFIGSLFKQSGAVGAVAPLVRDIDELRNLPLPLVAEGTHPAIIRHRVSRLVEDEPVCLGSVRIASGDLILADSDGTVVIPNDEKLVGELLEFLRQHAELEAKAWHDHKQGDPVSTVFSRYGVL